MSEGSPASQPNLPIKNVDGLSRIYGEETWRVYEMLDQSLEPRGPDSLYEVAGAYLKPASKVLDAGCRDASHLIRLVELYEVTGIGVDPVAVHIESAQAAEEAANVGESIEVLVGAMQDLPYPDGYFDFVWCGDVIEQVDDLDAALRESVRVLKDDGQMLVYTTFATDRLSASRHRAGRLRSPDARRRRRRRARGHAPPSPTTWS